ncbi:MAG: GCN5-related N-acetyltransferase [Parcubacteria group bacterium GW2011_GWE2_39_37]|uniref:GCN5-related N-acetyltransferase n=1 Tax=Candidatus Falkowbacteria bacterium GW2011_GWF2_39_8 TaxID=1618642 RepID=A0A0G0Q498_9BACT|nr:MAG: GCN5-related N-acetyltransferase [Parcubacteria group bacterium GW2011_GWE2_39_37]KKR32186.1 MAG: GCN5-related N-acetyltransferase [Candidatus Falkowbacteria bacterium GW2011_GWF2_39_8]
MKTPFIVIREAGSGDYEFVANLMHNALEPYYGGDHRAHAKRIFDAHLDGGHDKVGFFSFEQLMFIMEVDNVKAGMIHLVGKRQSTYKISPLIVAPEFQGHFGLGSRLLEHAEKYVRDQNARQLYCTVAEKNISAMQFFARKDFIRAGTSESHYKYGVTEVMLYKPFYEISAITSLDQMNVSVIPFDETQQKMKEQVTQLLLTKLPLSFEGITDEWVGALFAGYNRRNTADINAKYKLIFVAIDNNNDVIGVAAATPKKGSPIKVMPFIATNMVAFEALLIDIPHQLVPYGHKLYIHIDPTAEEVVALQQLGWTLDAAMPNSYRPGIITQQWSLNIGEKTMKTMRVKKRFYDLIQSGKKDIEVRVGYDSIKRIKNGEHIQLISHTAHLNVRVNAIHHYPSFETMLDNEPYNRIAPDASTREEVLSLLKAIYPPEKEKLGVIAFELDLLKK